MLLSNSDIIQNRRLIELESGEAAEALELRDGLTLILKPDAIALYRSLDSFFDPLGSGCMAYVELPTEQQLAWSNNQIMQEHEAGYVGLSEGKVLLITPNHIRVYQSKHNVLNHIDPIGELMLD
tara:strand:+ start:1440 stop:1811 length:372 start_codon:yes stop_codon:yes gene_type:complete